jgi:probable F420-dependent oxidoreductase
MGMRVSIAVYDMERWFGGDLAAVADMVALADRKGIDQISVGDHVVMGRHLQNYPYGKFPGRTDYPWLEPLTQLATYASVTKSIKLATGIIISPLRPAVLLAKQIATLDVLSRGRAEIGMGVGWQKEEYQACGVSWMDRFELMMEQVRVCRLLWQEAPASFKGRYLEFSDVWCMPQPVRRTIPLLFGIAATDKNIGRMAELADGWVPVTQEPGPLAISIGAIKQAFAKRGRDPDLLDVRMSLGLVRNNGRTDWEATLEQVPAFAAAGVTTVRLPVTAFCGRPEEYERFLERILQLKA